jgi:hypothetical protein
MRLLSCLFLLGFSALGCGAGAGNRFEGAGGSTSTESGGAGGVRSTGSSVFTTTSTGTWGMGGSEGNTTGTTGTSPSSATTSASAGVGGSAASSSSASSSSASSTSTSSGGVSGDCHGDGDCPSGHCVAITPGGFKVCVVPPVKATGCTGALDQCCPSANACPDQEPCYVGPLVPVCAGTPTPAHNQCGLDQCAKDVDCAPNQICAPAGTLGLAINACVFAYCKVDADCTAHPGGVCAPVTAPCCAASAGLFCEYPGEGGCRQAGDCPALFGAPERYCAPDPTSGTASCESGAPVCPP